MSSSTESSSSENENENENENLPRVGIIRTNLQDHLLSSSDSDSDSGQPPRRRLRLSNPNSNSPSPEVLIIRDCRVRVPRILTIPDSPPNSTNEVVGRPVGHTSSQPAAAVQSSSSSSSRITTRSASAAAAAASSSSPSRNIPVPGWRIRPLTLDSESSDFSLSPIYAPTTVTDLAFTSSSLSSDADSDTTTNWVHRRLLRRNAIVMEELEPVDVEPVDGDVEEEESSDDSSDSDSEGDYPSALDRLLLENAALARRGLDLNLPGNSMFRDSSNLNNSHSSNFGSPTEAAVVPKIKLKNEPLPGPSTKLDESTRSGDDDEGLTCLICYEPFTNSGEHRITCLKCGHTYGKACIEKWIRNEKRCPQCNAKAVKKDVRILYVKHLKAIDTVERDKLLVDLDKEKESKRKLELECARLRHMNASRESDFVKLNNELRLLRDRVGGVYRDPVSSSSETISSTVNSKNFVQSKILEFKEGEFRVGAYNEWLHMTAISQTLKSALYPHGCFGIKRINMLDLKIMQTTPIHQKEIRDLHFSNSQSDVLLSVGMDKKAILTNCNSNVIVQTFNTTQPLWSCTWNSMCQHLFYVGTNNGQIITYDLRSPQESVKVLTIPTEDKSPIARMHFITPSYQNSAFSLSGLIIQKLNSCWFCEIKNEKEIFHQLPIEGPLSSIDFEPKSRHMLISTRPSSKSPVGRHMVCELSQYYSTPQDSNICSCNVIQTFEGGPTGLGKMARSSIFSPVDGTVLVGANGGPNTVNLWNVSDVNLKQTVFTRDPVLDIVPSQVNDNFLLNMITSNGLQVYKQM